MKWILTEFVFCNVQSNDSKVSRFVLNSSFFISTGILPNSCRLRISVWMHHLDFNEKLEGKARWEIHIKAACCSEQILEAAPYDSADIQPLTSHLTNHPNKTSKTCLSLLKKQRRTHKAVLTGRQKYISVLCEHCLPSRGPAKSNGRLRWMSLGYIRSASSLPPLLGPLC